MTPRTLAIVTAAASLLTLSRVHRYDTADSLVPVLVSTVHWTPFYWFQDRYGMLVPLVCAPVTHPVANLLAQCGVTAWAGFAAAWLCARWVGAGAASGVVGAAASAGYVVLAPAWVQWHYFSTLNVFAVSTALGVGALVVLADARPAWWRWPAALLLLAVAAWVNAGIGLLLGPTGVLMALSRGRDGRGAARAGLAAGYATAVGVGLQHLFGTGVPTFADGSDLWWPNLAYSAEEFVDKSVTVAWAAAVLACVGCAAWRRAWPGLRVAGAVFVGGLVYGVGMAVLFRGQWRYAVPAVVLAHVAVVAAAAGPWLAARPPGWLRRAEWTGGGALCLTIVAAWGGPSVGEVETDLLRAHGAGAVELRAAGVTHVAGDYWRVWPAVFVLNWDGHAVGRPPVWGTTFRRQATAGYWEHFPRDRLRVGTFAGDPDAAEWRAELAPLRRLERRGPVEVWVPSEPRP